MKRKLILGLIVCLAFLAISVLPGVVFAETWTQVPPPWDANNEAAFATMVHEGNLYVGTANPTNGGELWRTTDGTIWTPAAAGGFGVLSNTDIDVGSVFNGSLYAGTWTAANTGQIYRSADGLAWSLVTVPFDANNHWVDPLVAYGGFIYAGTGNNVTGGEIWRSADGVSWNQVNDDGFNNPANISAMVTAAFEGNIYASTHNPTHGGEIWRSSNGVSWSQVATAGFGNPSNVRIWHMAALDGYLYAGTQNPSQGLEIWRSPDGSSGSWSPVETAGIDDVNNLFATSLSAVGGELYVGTKNLVAGPKVYRSTNGTTWTHINPAGFGAGDTRTHGWFKVLNGSIYVGVDNPSIGELWRLSLDNTSAGTKVNVPFGGGISLVFDNVSSGGSSTFTETTEAPSLPTGFNLIGTYYDISTDVSFTGPIEVTLPYDESEVQGNEADLKLFHWNGTSWEDVTVSVDTTNNKITGETTSLSPFAIAMSSPPTGVNTYWLLVV